MPISMRRSRTRLPTSLSMALPCFLDTDLHNAPLNFEVNRARVAQIERATAGYDFDFSDAKRRKTIGAATALQMLMRGSPGRRSTGRNKVMRASGLRAASAVNPRKVG